MSDARVQRYEFYRPVVKAGEVTSWGMTKTGVGNWVSYADYKSLEKESYPRKAVDALIEAVESILGEIQAEGYTTDYQNIIEAISALQGHYSDEED